MTPTAQPCAALPAQSSTTWDEDKLSPAAEAVLDEAKRVLDDGE
jgi:hypothetical protein